jgi:triacylglycerol esterase/lipase EstA (alpha/beta hydrolase family)
MAGDHLGRPSALERLKKVRHFLRRPGIRLRELDHFVRNDLSGARDMLSYFRHLARGNRIQRRKFFENIDENHPPVLLIHGYFGTRGSMYTLERRLNDDGICVFSFNLGTVNVRDVKASAILIQRKIEAILAQTNVKKIDIVGHSMGGLIGLYYAKKLGGHERVRKLVMLGTPLRGTWVALAGIATMGLLWPSAWQLLPGSSFLRELNDGPLPRDVQYYTIVADRDWICPPASSTLEEASHMSVPLGHSSLVLSEEVYRHVLWALRQKGRASNEGEGNGESNGSESNGKKGNGTTG